MSLMKKQIRRMLIVGLFIGVTMPAAAGSEREAKFIERMTKELSLTAEQQAKLKEIKSQASGEVREKKRAMKVAHEELEKALKSSADDQSVRTKFNNLNKLQDEYANARFEKILLIRSILTPEQRQKFDGLEHHGDKKNHKGKN